LTRASEDASNPCPARRHDDPARHVPNRLKSELQIQQPLLIGLLILTVLRWVMAGTNELSEDEAYYHMWSERLAPSYYSKGPGIASTMKLSTAVFGHGEFGIRFFSPLLALGSSLMLFRLARGIFNRQVAAWAVLLLNITPIFNAGAMLMTIDPISIFFWIATMLMVWHALHRASKWTIYWPLAGLMVGLGFLAKYTNALLLLSIALLLVVHRRWRGQLRKPGPYLALGVFVLCTIPVLIWNQQHDWITVTHLKERGDLDETTGVKPLEALAFFLGHLSVYSPLIFAGMLWALALSVRRFFIDAGEAFLVAFSLPIIALYFALSLRSGGELNWTSPGFVGVGVLLAHHWFRWDGSPILKRRLRRTAIGFAVGMSLLAINTDLLRQTGITWSYKSDPRAAPLGAGENLTKPHLLLANADDPSARLRGWRKTADYCAEVIRAQGQPLFLIANRYQTAAVLDHYLPDDLDLIRPTPAHPRVHTPESVGPEHQFWFWPGYAQVESQLVPSPDGGDTVREEFSPFIGQDALYFTDDMKRKSPDPTLKNSFAEWELIMVVDIMRRGQFVRQMRIFHCKRYRGLDL